MKNDPPTPDALSSGGKLYKYRSMGSTEENRKRVLNRQVWFSRPSQFNDPWDCHLYVPYRLSSGELGERLIRRLFASWNHGEDADESWATLKAAARGEAVSPKERKRALAVAARKFALGLAKVGGVSVAATAGEKTVDVNELVNDRRGDRLKRVVDALDRSIGVLCLTESRDHVSMWSHYGDNHRGVCLEYDVEKLRDSFPRLQPVRYGPMPKISPKFPAMIEKLAELAPEREGALVAALASLLAGADEDHASDPDLQEVIRSEVRYLVDWFYTKSTAWETEREWRALAPGHGLMDLPPNALTGVIVGCSATEETLAAVRSWAEAGDQKIEVSLAVRRENDYGLDIVPQPTS